MSGTEASEYDILQVRIDRDATGAYQTLAMGPDGRTARGSFHLSISDDELDDFVQKVGLVRRRRGPAEDRLRAIREFGSQLYSALFNEQVGSVYNSAKAAAFDGNRRLRISLRLSGAPELLRLPWEFLYDRPRFIAQSTDTPLVRSLDVGSGRRPQRVTLPLRILGIVSSPVGYEELDADSERQNLETALDTLRREGLVELFWLERATLRELGRRISEPDEIHVIHYIGHGAYDEATEAGVLVLERSDGRAADVSGEVLGAMLQDERSLRLVVLNSCEGARTSHVDPFSGVATSLIEFDIPAVVGMQFEITDEAAIAFSDALYRGLAQGMPIDAAIAPARRAIMSIKEAEFGTPVLFLRDGDAHLFDINAAPDIATASDSETMLSRVDTENARVATEPSPLPPEDSGVNEEEESGDGLELITDEPSVQASQSSSGVEGRDPSRWLVVLTRAIEEGAKRTILRLLLSQDHEIVITDTTFRAMLDVDGERIEKVAVRESFRIADGGVTRVCKLSTELRVTDGDWLREVLGCHIDGVALRIWDRSTIGASEKSAISDPSHEAAQNVVGGSGVVDEGTKRPVGETASPTATRSWLAEANYLKIASMRGMTTVKLKLNSEHEIVSIIGLASSRLEVDGVRVSHNWLSNTVDFEIDDDGAIRRCTLETTQSLTGWPSSVPRVISLSVDGIKVPVRHGLLRS